MGFRDRGLPARRLRLQRREGRRALHAAALSAGPHPGRLRARHRVEPGALGGDGERAARRPGDRQSLPALVLHLQQRQPDRALRHAPARGHPGGRARSRSRRNGRGAAADGGDRPQPGRSADQDDRGQQRQRVLGQHQRGPVRGGGPFPEDARSRAPLAVHRAAADGEASRLHLHAAPRQLPGRELSRPHRAAPRPPARHRDQGDRGAGPAAARASGQDGPPHADRDRQHGLVERRSCARWPRCRSRRASSLIRSSRCRAAVRSKRATTAW